MNIRSRNDINYPHAKAANTLLKSRDTANRGDVLISECIYIMPLPEIQPDLEIDPDFSKNLRPTRAMFFVPKFISIIYKYLSSFFQFGTNPLVSAN